jgi:hypothetical protein
MNEEDARVRWDRDVARADAVKARRAQKEAEDLLDYAKLAIQAEYQRACVAEARLREFPRPQSGQDARDNVGA